MSAVQITKTVVEHGKKTLSIDKGALEEIFCTKEVKDKHVAIYSIAGMLRKGKSFFLTLAIRYLQFKERNKESEWMDSKSDVLEGGFKYKGGAEGHTQGILVWSQPFWLYTAKGAKVAVFLMDTQGLFDEKSDPTMDNILFSLSTFLSSFQIYNMGDVLNHLHLDRLRTFIEFGNRMHESNAQTGQTLLFLLRNWQDRDYKYGLEGGGKYLNKVLAKTRDTSEDYKVLCRNITRSFQVVKCALLPYPGNGVAERGKDSPSIKISDVEEKFLKAINGLFKTIFSNISSKQTCNHLLKGEDVVNQILLFSNNIKDRAFTADVLYRSAVESFLANVVQRCEHTFQDKIQEHAEEYMQPDALNEIYAKIVEEVLQEFDDYRKVSSETDIDECRKQLHESLNERKFVLQNFNAVYEKGIDENYRNWLNEAKEKFTTNLMEFCKIPKYKKNFLESTALSDLVTDGKLIAKKTFERSVGESNIFDEATYKSFCKKLENELSVIGNIMKNKHRIAKIAVKRDLQEGYSNALELYINKYKQDQSKSIDKEYIARLGQSALDVFDKSDVDGKLPIWKEERERLQKVLKKLKEVSEETLAIKKTAQNAGNSVNELLLEKRKEFKDKISEIDKTDLTDSMFQTFQEQVLQSCSKEKLRSCRRLIEDMCKNQQGWYHLKRQIKEESKRFKCVSDFYSAVCPLEIPVPQQPTWWQSLFKSKTPDVFENVDNKIEVARKKLAQIESDSDTEKPEWMQELKNDFDAIETNIKENHCLHQGVNKIIVDEKCGKIRKVLIWKYTEQMIEMLNGKYLTDQNLIKVHDNIISIGNKEIDANINDSEAADEVKHFFKVDMGVQLANWEKYNEFHMRIYPRQLTRLEEFLYGVKQSFKGYFESILAKKVVVRMVAFAHVAKMYCLNQSNPKVF